MIPFLRTILLSITAFFATFFIGLAVIIAGLFRVKDKPGGIYDKAPRWWSTAVLWAVGIKIRVHGLENAAGDEPRIFASIMSAGRRPALPRSCRATSSLAKAELFKVPIFGPRCARRG